MTIGWNAPIRMNAAAPSNNPDKFILFLKSVLKSVQRYNTKDNGTIGQSLIVGTNKETTNPPINPAAPTMIRRVRD